MTARHSYSWTLLRRSLEERKGRVLVSVLTVALGTSVVGAFLTLYADIQTKMRRELRAYGANFVVRPGDGRTSLGGDALAALDELVPPERLVGSQPFLYDIVTLKGRRVAAVGIVLGRIAATTPYWQLVRGGLPAGDTGCLLGKDTAAALHVEVGQEIELGRGDRVHKCAVSALVETGGSEDSQVFLPIEAARTLFSRPGEIDLVLASVIAGADEAETLARSVERRVPGSRAEPIRKLSRSEGRVLDTIRSVVYMVVLLITLSAFVGLLISLMAMVSERRKEMALMKALGATDLVVSLHFLAEVVATGLVGGTVGVVAGFGMAQLMEQTIFGTAVTFHPWLVPPVLAIALGISVAGAVIPLRAVTAVQPAVVLKGD